MKLYSLYLTEDPFSDLENVVSYYSITAKEAMKLLEPFKIWNDGEVTYESKRGNVKTIYRPAINEKGEFLYRSRDSFSKNYDHYEIGIISRDDLPPLSPKKNDVEEYLKTASSPYAQAHTYSSVYVKGYEEAKKIRESIIKYLSAKLEVEVVDPDFDEDYQARLKEKQPPVPNEEDEEWGDLDEKS